MAPTRREFMHSAFAAALAGRLSKGSVAPDGISRIGIQLYTVRSLLDKDLDGVLAALRKIGYREVELAGLHGRTATQFREALDRADLTAPSAHFDFSALRSGLPKILDDAKALGLTYVTAAWIDAADRKSLADYQKIAAEMNVMADKAKAASLRFAYHNHDYVFQRMDGKMPYDVLLAETSRDLVAFEMDVYWTVSGGGDPRRYFESYPGRFPMLHMKDRTKDGKMADVGAGAIDFAKIIANAGRGGVRHFFVEHDEPADPIASARASFAYLDRLKIPKSRKAKKA